jgi:superfamily II DNA or RNA helicase
MKLVVRDPRAGYLDTWLWLPKAHASRKQVQAAFSYFDPKTNKSVEAWAEEAYHYRVPRNYLLEDTLRTLPFPVYDTRPPSFPAVQLTSKVVLDSREPDKTFQAESCAALLNARDGILCLKCGGGKTCVALHSAAQLGVPVLVVVSDKGLAQQWIDEIELCLGIPSAEVGRIGGDRSSFDWEHPITVGLVQSIAGRISDGRFPVELTHHFGVTIFDECHLMGAPHFNTAAPPFRGRRWGLSATPSREDGFDTLLRYTLGPVVYSYLQPDLKPTVFFRQLPTRLDLSDRNTLASTHDKSGAFHFGMTYGHFARSVPERTEIIAKEIKSAVGLGRQVLVLTHSLDMVEALAPHFPSAGIVHGKILGTERFRRIRECNPVIAIMQLGKQALNKPSLDTLFVCDPFTKRGIIQQTMGRVLRTFSGKKTPVVVFFEDVYIKPLSRMCGNIRLRLNRWPEHKGGAIPYKIVKA